MPATKRRRKRRNPESHAAGKARETAEKIESLIDSAGLTDFVDLSADVCFAKSLHVSEMWQDRTLARQWERAGEILQRAHASIKKLGMF